MKLSAIFTARTADHFQRPEDAENCMQENLMPSLPSALLQSTSARGCYASRRMGEASRISEVLRLLSGVVRVCIKAPASRGIVWEDPETGQRQVLDFGVPTPGPTEATVEEEELEGFRVQRYFGCGRCDDCNSRGSTRRRVPHGHALFHLNARAAQAL